MEEIILKLIKDLSEANIEPKFSDYNTDVKEFGDIVDMVQNEGYISGAKVVRGGQDNEALVIFLNTTKITIKGLQYLEDNKVDAIAEEDEYSDEELENQLLEILFNERGSRKSAIASTIHRRVESPLGLFFGFRG